MIEYQFRPLGTWPGKKTSSRQRARFRTRHTDTLRDLSRELDHLVARQVVIQADCGESEIRRDGMLRADARLNSPAIILSFNSKHGPLSYPCDTYISWQDNLRAITLALEALRAVDRYGVTKQAEQYKGWQALPPPANIGMTLEQARAFIALTVGAIVRWDERDQVEAAIRCAEMKTHPDRGGNGTAFKQVQAARQIILGDTRA